MKFLSTLTLLLVISALGVGRVQAQNDVVNAVVTSLTAGSGEAMANYFGDRVEITLFNQTHIYSSTQAKYAITQFFSDYPAKDFALLNKGNTGETSYILGTLLTEKGNFKVKVHVRVSGDSGRIEQIRFDLR
ncbi:MAG: DUF4783 domain-containing protein [Bacteroidota bacterium]